MQNLLSPIIGKFDSVVSKVLQTGINALSSSNCSCDLFTHEALGRSYEPVKMCSSIPD